MAFSLGNGGNFGDIVSDQYSFLDQDANELKADGNGGMKQMHNYVDLNTAFSGNISNTNSNDNNTTIRGASKMGEDASNQIMEDRIKKMKEESEPPHPHQTSKITIVAHEDGLAVRRVWGGAGYADCTAGVASTARTCKMELTVPPPDV